MCLKFPKVGHFCQGRNVPIFPSEETPQLTHDMSGFFRGAIKFNQDINFWDTSNVTTMERMFHSASNLENLDVSNCRTRYRAKQ